MLVFTKSVLDRIRNGEDLRVTVAIKFPIRLGSKSKSLQVETSPETNEPGFRAEKSRVVYTLPSAFAVAPGHLPQRQAPPAPPTIQHPVHIKS